MKLNMWMIANRLRGYEFESSINPMADMVLNGVLPVFAIGCVRVYADGSDVICEHDQGRIRIRDLGLEDGYMLIQAIFDWYQDWVDRVDEAVYMQNYKVIAEQCAEAFDNPVMIQDSNYRLLGMAGDFGTIGMPEGWNIIKKNGQSSVEYYSAMSYALRNSSRVYRYNVREWEGFPGSQLSSSGLHGTVSFRGMNFAKITVLSAGRAVNRGDICLLEFLSRRLSIYLAATACVNKRHLDFQLFESLVAGESVSDYSIQFYLDVIKYNGDSTFAVMDISYVEEGRTHDYKARILLENLIKYRFPSTFYCFVKDELYLLLYAADPMNLALQIMRCAEMEGFSDALNAGISLPYRNLQETIYFSEQAALARLNAPVGKIASFYDSAVSALLNLEDQRKICACEPDLRRFWEEQPDKRAYLETLNIYLEEERAAQTAANRLHIHKNTLTYRIKYLKDIMPWNLGDSFVRNYLRMSYYVLSQSSRD